MKTIPALVLAGLLLAGCISQPKLEEESKDAYHFDGYTFPQPVALTGNATVLATHPLLDPAVRPHFVEKLVTGGGGEPNVGLLKSKNIFVTTLDQVRRSTDGGVTWKVVFDFHSPNAPTTKDMWGTSDPMMWADTATDRLYVVQMHPGTTCMFVAWSDDNGDHWTDENPVPAAPGTGACPFPINDHEKIVTGKPGPDAKVTPQGYPNMVYICYNKVLPQNILFGTWCQSSYDGGKTWVMPTQAFPGYPTETACVGLNGHPAVGPDGTLFVPAGNFGGRDGACQKSPRVAVSRDSGLTWEVRQFPGKAIQRSIDPDLTFTPDGTAYMVYTDQDSMTYLLRSKDQFKTWEGPFRLSPADHTMDVFGAIASGDDGRIAVAYLGSTTKQPEEFRQVDSSGAIGGTRWHLYVVVSTDAASEHPTFLSQQVTPNEDPVQVGCVWLKGGSSTCRNLLDFIDLHHDADGRYVLAFTDGCNPRDGCTTDPDSTVFQSHDMDIAVAVLDSGLGAFAAKGPLPSLGLHFVAPPDRDPEAHRDGGSP